MKQCTCFALRAVDCKCKATLSDENYSVSQTEHEPLAFKIYKPTPPQGATSNVRDAELPWVYDQDPSSGNVASMWVTPVHTHPQPKREWVGLTDEELELLNDCGDTDSYKFARAIETKLKEKNT